MLVSSPRTWGCFSYLHSTWRARRVFPTHVGVFLSIKSSSTSTRCLPHARGGVSRWVQSHRTELASSPRTWGCFRNHCHRSHRSRVFPTHVGVFLETTGETPSFVCLPHARGGVSTGVTGHSARPRSSPRTWGCFPCAPLLAILFPVFPTHVGVFPKPKRCHA